MLIINWWMERLLDKQKECMTGVRTKLHDHAYTFNRHIEYLVSLIWLAISALGCCPNASGWSAVGRPLI